jgi:predicted RNase H-like nuclease (RuvC/YqgF family)
MKLLNSDLVGWLDPPLIFSLFQDQVERLESEIRQFRKHSGGGEQSFIREIQVLEERNRDLEKAVGNNEKQLMEERRNNDQLSGKFEQAERQNKELKREVIQFFSM